MSHGARREPPAVLPPRAVGTAFARADDALRMANEDPVRARAEAERALAEADRAGDVVAAAQAERALGMVARNRQDMSGAAQHFGKAIRLADRGGATEIAAHTRISRALALAYSGKMVAAHADLDRAASALEGTELAKVEFQRANVLQIQGQLEQAEERFDRALPLLRKAGALAPLAILYNNRGLIRSRRGLLAKAEADLRQAVTLYQECGHLAAAAEASGNLGLVAARRGDVLAALEHFDAADKLADQADDPLEAVDAIGLLDRAEALLSGRLLTEAREIAERAIVEQEKRGLSAYLAEARLVLARVALYEGNHVLAGEQAACSATAFAQQRRPSYRALAEELRIHAAWRSGERSAALLAASRRTAAALDRNGWLVAAIDAHLVAAQVAVAIGRPAVARAELAGLVTPRRGDPAALRSRAYYATALLCLLDGDKAGATAALRTGMIMLERLRRDLGGTEVRAHAAGHAADLATLGLRLAVESGDPLQVLRWAERWRASTLSMHPVRPPRDEEMTEALGVLRQLSGPDAPGTHAALRYRQAAAERTVRRLARRGGSGPGRYDSQAVQTGKLHEALGDRALVELVDVDGTLYAVVVANRGRRTLHELGSTLAATRLVITHRFWLRRLVHQFGSTALLAQMEADAAKAAAQLDDLLMAPLRRRIGDRPLVVVPTAALHGLAWAALPCCAERPVAVAPSTRWWARAATAPVPPSPGRTVLVGGPNLRHAAAEIAALRAIYPTATTLTGEQASCDNVTAALDGAELAHVAAHGNFRADQPLLSSLQFTDGPLFVYHLERLTASPRTLVLASCDAGLSGVLPGDELTGVAACVLAQGTSTLIAPLLPVPDADTQPVMLALHRRLAAGRAPADALADVRRGASGAPHELTAALFACIGAG
jgi:tetratricopeptide (TPR) repeat protein